MPKKLVSWLPKPEDHDYPAAGSYLRLHFPERVAAQIVSKLRKAPMAEFKAKDIFRASGLPLLPLSNAHVKKDEKKIITGHQVSPLLLYRDPVHGRVIVADGYHRMCAVYAFDEDAMIPCKIV